MGLSFNVLTSCVSIPIETQEIALETIKNLINTKKESNQNFKLAFIDSTKLLKSKTLTMALETARWFCETDEKGNITNLEFIGEKIGDDLLLFKAIAPYVLKKSYIILVVDSENGPKIWKWLFSDGKVKEIPGKIIFES